MGPSKRFENESNNAMKPQAGPTETTSGWPEAEEAELTPAAEQRRRLRTILGRAAGAYLVLFFGLGLVMSAFGSSPLANNGLMPKVLLIFVGLALVIALANTLTDLFREQGRNWLRLARGGATSKKLDE